MIKKEKVNKKAQLTFFILLGFIVLMIWGLVFYVGKQTAGTKTRTEALESLETPLEVISIKNHITSCLEKTAKDGMLLLGKQKRNLE